MPARNPLYALPTDNVAPAATWSLPSGTEDAFNPLIRLTDLDPSLPFMTSSTGTIVNPSADHGSAIVLQGASMHGHNLPSGTAVFFQRSTASNFGSLGMNVPATIGALPADGLPRAFALDLRLAAGQGAYRYSRWHVPSVAQIVAIGETGLWTALRSDVVNLIAKDVRHVSHPSRVWRAGYGNKNVYPFGTRPQWQEVAFLVNGADRDAIMNLVDACLGQGRRFLWWRDTNVPEAWFASFMQDEMREEYVEGNFALSNVIEEMTQGLEFPT